MVADFNGDGRPDVFIADTGDDRDPYAGFQNTLMLSAPAGKLVDATATLPQASDYSHSACTGDINGDGHPDIYVGNIYGVNNITPRLLLNDGTGHFTIGGSLPGELEDPNFTARYTTCTFADVNGDRMLGRRTLPIVAPQGSRIYILCVLPLLSLALVSSWSLGPLCSILFVSDVDSIPAYPI